MGIPESEPAASVLIVDDDVDLGDSTADALSVEGFQVAVARSGSDALKMAREIRFDVVVCDLRMEGLSGEDTLAALKAIDPEIEVVMTTAAATVESAVECMRRGAFDYLEKPYPSTQLSRVVRRALEHSQLLGGVELYEASRALVALPPERVADQVAVLGRKLFRADAAALVLQRGTELDVRQADPAGAPSDLLARELAVRGVQTPAPFRFVSPRAEGIPSSDSDDAFAAGLVCPLRTHARTEGALVLLRRQGSPPFTIAVVRRAMTFAALAALAIAHSAGATGGPLPDSAARLIGETRVSLDALQVALETGGDVRLQAARLDSMIRGLERLLLARRS